MKRILVVDDSEVARHELSGHLKECGYDVETCDSAESALERLKKGVKVDLLISDYIMPDKNGIELAHLCRQIPGYEAVPIALLSAQFVAAVRDEAKAAGIKAMIYKPITKEVLAGIVPKLF